jgi:ribose 5-phosphate isomerase A
VDMDQLKRQAAAKALEHVSDGMKLGLGTGSTARHFVDLLGEKVAGGNESGGRAHLGSDPRPG